MLGKDSSRVKVQRTPIQEERKYKRPIALGNPQATSSEARGVKKLFCLKKDDEKGKTNQFFAPSTGKGSGEGSPPTGTRQTEDREEDLKGGLEASRLR